MNILIIGIGSIAQKHIISINKYYQDVKIIALRSSKDSKEIKGVINIFNLNELIYNIDFVIISNPTFLHEKTILECINLRIPLFIEKPVLSNLANSTKIAKLIREYDIKTYVACNLRFHPSIIFLKQHLFKIQDKINEVNIYFGSYLPNWRPGKDYKQIYSSHKNLGGGVHLDLIHEIDYCVWLFGKPISVNSIKRKVSNLDIDSDDYASYSLVYSNFVVNIILNYYRVDTKRTIEILLESDTIITNLIENSIYSIKNNNLIFSNKFDMSDTYDDQIKYFINSLKNNSNLMNNFDESVEILKLALNE